MRLRRRLLGSGRRQLVGRLNSISSNQQHPAALLADPLFCRIRR
jgi:hypothetical protein